MYYLLLFSIPSSIVQQIDRWRSYIWNAYDGSSKFPLVNWSQICKLINQGGLGVLSLKPMNKALLLKWLRRFENEKQALCQLVISAKYDLCNLGWRIGPADGPFGVGVWKGIMSASKWFHQFIAYKVGDSYSIL